MAWTLLSSTKLTPDAAGGTTSPINTTGATLLVIGIARHGTSFLVSDSEANSFTPLTIEEQDQIATQMSYCLDPITSATHTLDVGSAETEPVIIFAAFSGDGTDTFDTSDGAVANNTGSVTPGPITPAEVGALLLTMLGLDAAGSTLSLPDGYTEVQTAQPVLGTNVGGALAYKIPESVAAEAPTWDWTAGGAQDAAAIVASFIGEAPPPPVALFLQTSGGCVVMRTDP